MTDELRNYGALIADPKESDFRVGGVSGIEYKVVNPSGDWADYLPTDEQQSWGWGDSFGCVSFSANNCIETILNHQIATGILPKADVDWLTANGYIESGKVNLSDRYLAKMSGTTRNGNYLNTVADTLRHYGAVPEKDWNSKVDRWERYYIEVMPNVIAKGKDFAARFDIQYEWVCAGTSNLDAIRTHLKQAPIQIATAVCSGWSTDSPVKACEKPVQHATTVFRVDSVVNDFDHYAPYRKQLVASYNIPYAMKYVVSPRSLASPQMDSTAMDILKKRKRKIIRNAKTGAFGYSAGDKLLVPSAERAGLLALTVLSEASVSDEVWEKFPKEPF